MKPPLSADAGVPAGQAGVEQLLEQFELAWRSGTPPRLEAFAAPLPPSDPAANGPARQEFLRELIKTDLEYQWQQTAKDPMRPVRKAPLLEDYVQRYPELRRSDSLLVQLIAEEYRARQLWGDHPGHGEYAARFAQLGTKVQATLLRMDAELTAEFGAEGLAPHQQGEPRRQHPPLGGSAEQADESLFRSVGLQEAVRPVASVSDLVDALRLHGLLGLKQLNELLSDLKGRFVEPRALARHLLDLDWLTPYQVNQLLRGRGAELVLGPYLLLERLGEGVRARSSKHGTGR
jgi:hypothetical protein